MPTAELVKSAIPTQIQRKGKDFQPTRVKDPIKFMREMGILFKINQTVLHPIGYALVVQTNEDGDDTYALMDHTKYPVVHFDEKVYIAGRKKWLAFWTIAVKVNHLRKQLLGFPVQLMADIRAQRAA